MRDPSSGSGSVVEGVAYQVQSVQNGARLAEYETGSYRAEPCVISYTDGREPKEEIGQVSNSWGMRERLVRGCLI